MKDVLVTTTCETPLGTATLASDGASLTGLWLEGQKYFGPPAKTEVRALPSVSSDSAFATSPEQSRTAAARAVFDQTQRWLELYFSGQEPDFCPPLELDGTDFQKTVWSVLRTIPYGKTMTYGEVSKLVAAKLGRSAMSAQAVGGAVGRNPISIIVPCHRVIGADGSLTGYAGGLWRKEKLLRLERGEKEP